MKKQLSSPFPNHDANATSGVAMPTHQRRAGRVLGTLVIVPLLTGVVQAATVISSDDFETDLGTWVATGTSSGLYEHQVALQPTDDTATNFATGTSGTNFTTGGTGAASIGKGGGKVTSTTIDLSGGGTAETLTISLDFVWHNGTSTRRAFIDYSNDGGTTWYSLAMMQLGGAVLNKVSYDGSLTITEGSSTVVRTGSFLTPNLTSNAGALNYDGSAFTNNSLIRILNNASAGADARLFVDNVEVSTSINMVPEPSVALLGACGVLLLWRRRR